MASPDPVVELLAENERARDQLRAERNEARAERDALKEALNEARQVSVRQESQSDDEELKRRSLRIAEELFQFWRSEARKTLKALSVKRSGATTQRRGRNTADVLVAG